MAAMSYHASDRMYSRLGLCGPAAMDRIEAALRDGLAADTAPGNLGVYLRHAVIPYGGARAVAHEDALFVFNADDCLVTCWPLPDWCSEPSRTRHQRQVHSMSEGPVIPGPDRLPASVLKDEVSHDH